MHPTVTIIVIEDDQVLRESLVEYLSLIGHRVTGVGSGLEFYQAIAQVSFEIAVVDVGLPDQDGFVLTKYIRDNTAMKIIMLTARSAITDRVKGYDAGADLYLVKPVDLQELSAAISSLANRQRSNHRPPQLLTSEKWRLAWDSWELIAPGGSAVELTAKELQFLEALLETPGIPVSREELIGRLGYGENEYANRAIDSLVRRLRRKIEESAQIASPIKTVHAIGYCFTSPAVSS